MPVELISDEKEDEIIIYPNPAKTSLTMTIKSEEDIKKINIFNQVGRLVLQVNSEYSMIDISQFPKGIYVVEVEVKDKKLYKKR